MRDLAARFDHALATAVGATLGQDLTRTPPDGGLRRASSSTWVGLLVVALALTLVLGRRDSWAASIVAALVLTVPLAMTVLRGVVDELRGGYTRGGPIVVVLLAGSFVAGLVATQPI